MEDGKILYPTRRCRLFYYWFCKVCPVVKREICMSTRPRTSKQCSLSFLTFRSSESRIHNCLWYFAIFFKNIFTVRDSHSYFLSKNVVLHLIRKHLKISVKEFTLNACNWFILIFKAFNRKYRTVRVTFFDVSLIDGTIHF